MRERPAERGRFFCVYTFVNFFYHKCIYGGLMYGIWWGHPAGSWCGFHIVKMIFISCKIAELGS